MRRVVSGSSIPATVASVSTASAARRSVTAPALSALHAAHGRRRKLGEPGRDRDRFVHELIVGHDAPRHAQLEE